MSNEELAVLIKRGETEYVQTLWLQVERFISMKAGKRFRWLKSQGLYMSGAEEEDFIQAGFLGLLRAVQYYDPAKQAKLTTILSWFLSRQWQFLTGSKIHVNADKKKVLQPPFMDNCLSLDTPVTTLDGSDLYLLDILAERSNFTETDDFDKLVSSIYLRELHEALDEALSILTERARTYIQYHYRLGMTLDAIAEIYGVTRQSIVNSIEQSLYKIRISKHARILYEFTDQYNFDAYKQTGLTSWQNTWCSVEDRFLIEGVS